MVQQRTIVEVILKLSSGVCRVSGLGILGIGCIYFINDATGSCIKFLEYIPKMLTQDKNNNIICIPTLTNTNNSITESTHQSIFMEWMNNSFYRKVIIGSMIAGGIALRHIGNCLNFEKNMY